MLRSFNRMLAVDVGFDADRIVTFSVQPLDPSPAAKDKAYPALLENVRRLPGVIAAGAVDTLPLGGSLFTIVAQGDSSGGVQVVEVLPGHFKALDMRLLSGRLPTDSDRTSARAVAVISQQAAMRLFPTGPVLGRQVKLRSERLEVVGVVADIRSDGPLRHVEPTVYHIYQPEVDPFKALTIVVRPSGNAWRPAGTAAPGGDEHRAARACRARPQRHGLAGRSHRHPAAADRSSRIARGARRRPRASWRVRGHGVRRGTAHARNWRAHGVRSTAGPGRPDGAARYGPSDQPRPARRPRRRGARHARDRLVSL